MYVVYKASYVNICIAWSKKENAAHIQAHTCTQMKVPKYPTYIIYLKSIKKETKSIRVLLKKMK